MAKSFKPSLQPCTLHVCRASLVQLRHCGSRRDAILPFHRQDSSWIIIILSYAPDLDVFAAPLHQAGVTVFLEGQAVYHGMFHNIAAMLIFGVIFACIFYAFEIRFLDALFFSLMGFGAHLFEDALISPLGYAFLWPFSHQSMGLGWLMAASNEETYRADFFHIANTEVLTIGIVLLLAAI